MITTINTNPMRVVVVDADGQTMNDDALPTLRVPLHLRSGLRRKCFSKTPQ